MVSIFYGTCLQGLYCALRCYVASYIILVYDVVRCRYVPPWWCVKFYTTMVHDVVWILGYVLWGTYLFYAQFWILDLFSKIQKFGRSGRRPSSVGLAVVRRSLSAFHVDVVNTFHVDVRIFLCFARRTIFIWCASSWFEPRAMQHDLFSGPGFDSRALLHVYRPVRSVAYVTRPHDWRISVACGKRKPLWGKNHLAMAWGKNKPPWGKKFLKSPSSMQKPGCTGEKASWCVTSCYTYKIVCINHKRKCLWRGRLMLLLCLSCDMHKRQFLYSAPKSWWWLSSAWDPDCPIVWMLW